MEEKIQTLHKKLIEECNRLELSVVSFASENLEPCVDKRQICIKLVVEEIIIELPNVDKSSDVEATSLSEEMNGTGVVHDNVDAPTVGEEKIEEKIEEYKIDEEKKITEKIAAVPATVSDEIDEEQPLTQKEQIKKENIPAKKNNDKKGSPVEEVKVMSVESFRAEQNDELGFIEDEIFVALAKNAEEEEWWWGQLRGKIGLFPSNYIKVLKGDPTKLPLKTFEQLMDDEDDEDEGSETEELDLAPATKEEEEKRKKWMVERPVVYDCEAQGCVGKVNIKKGILFGMCSKCNKLVQRKWTIVEQKEWNKMKDEEESKKKRRRKEKR